MKYIPFVLIFVALSLSVAAQTPTEKPPSILHVLKKGQAVNVKEEFGRYEISFFEGVSGVQPYSVKAIEVDHLVLEDVAKVREASIPAHSITSIIRVKLTVTKGK